MTQKYLLPCECGKTHPVDVSQAGLSIRCECGRELEVPTLAGLRKLEPVPATSQTPESTWGAGQGLIFLGGVLLGIGLAVAAYFYNDAGSHHPDLADIQERIDLVYTKLTPSQVWYAEWNDLKRGIDIERLDPMDHMIQYGHAYAATRYRWAWAWATVAGIGAVLLVIGLIVHSSTRPRTQKRK